MTKEEQIKDFIILLSLEKIFRMNGMMSSCLQMTIVRLSLGSGYQWSETRRGGSGGKRLTRNSQGRKGKTECVRDRPGRPVLVWKYPWCLWHCQTPQQREQIQGGRNWTFLEREKSLNSPTFTFRVLSHINMALILANLEK